MQIGIDARVLAFPGCPTGLYQYSHHLLKALQRNDRSNTYRLFFNSFRNEFRRNIKAYRTQENFQKRNLAIPHDIAEVLFNRFNLPVDVVLGKIDVFHGLAFETFPCRSARTLVTIHDTMFITDPNLLPAASVRRFSEVTARALSTASAVIANSEFTKQELLKKYRVPSDRIQVIYLGVNEQFAPDRDHVKIGSVRGKYGIRNKYILYFGNIEPKKNITGIVRAFDLLLRAERPDHDLVIAGRKTYPDYWTTLEREIADRKLGDRVIFTDVVPAEDVPHLYSGSDAFIFPSFYEGFGMPPLEAMACGIPVIVSDILPLREVCGDAALLVDPKDPEAMAQAMHEALFDGDIRNTLIEKGVARSSRFSWDDAAKRTIRLYEAICS